MSIESQTSSVSFDGNGSAVTAYAIPFRFDDPAWLTATHIAEDGTETVLVDGDDYTLAGSNLTTAVAIVAEDTLRIDRNTPIKQTVETDSPAGAFITAVEAQLDRLTMAMIDLERRMGLVGITIGAVTHLEEGETPTASISGTWPNLVLNLGLPTGATGGLDIGADASFGTLPNDVGGPALAIFDYGTLTMVACWLENGEFKSGTFSP